MTSTRSSGAGGASTRPSRSCASGQAPRFDAALVDAFGDGLAARTAGSGQRRSRPAAGAPTGSPPRITTPDRAGWMRREPLSRVVAPPRGPRRTSWQAMDSANLLIAAARMLVLSRHRAGHYESRAVRPRAGQGRPWRSESLVRPRELLRITLPGNRESARSPPGERSATRCCWTSAAGRPFSPRCR